MKTAIITFFIILVIFPALWSQNAPITSTGRVTDAAPGDPAVPVSVYVNNFTEIAQLTLTMKFDTTRVRYVSSATNPELTGMTVTYIHPSGNTQGKLIFNWSDSSNVNLLDGTSIVNLVFHYVTGTGNLTWAYTFGSVCQFKRWSEGMLISLSDSPKYTYYKNGGISYRGAPLALAPVINDPVPGSCPVPVIVDDFINIIGFTLYLEYDPLIITYSGTFVKNPAFDSNFLVGDNPGTNGKRLIVMQWYGSPVNLADDQTLCTLDFSYLAATCNTCLLRLYDTGPTCQYSEANGDVLIDSPKDYYYFDGLVAPGLPATWTGNAGNTWNNAGNWTSCGMPDANRNVVIPNVSSNHYPIIINTVHCKSINVENGATLTISQDGMLMVGE
jgi:hypothetical protein